MSVSGASASAIDAEAFGELRNRFRGALLRPGEEGYDEARRIWNGAIDRRPALIARCAGADDVARAVRSHVGVTSQFPSVAGALDRRRLGL